MIYSVSRDESSTEQGQTRLTIYTKAGVYVGCFPVRKPRNCTLEAARGEVLTDLALNSYKRILMQTGCKVRLQFLVVMMISVI